MTCSYIILVLELFVAKSPRIPTIAPGVLKRQADVHPFIKVLIFNFLGHTIHCLEVRVLYRYVCLPLLLPA